MARKPQYEQALAMLAHAGPRGVHSFEMRRAMIGNPSERIRELRELGHKIDTGDRERLNGEAWGVRWFLVERAAKATTEGVIPGPSRPVSDSPLSSPSAPVTTLFNPPRARPASAIDGEAA